MKLINQLQLINALTASRTLAKCSEFIKMFKKHVNNEDTSQQIFGTYIFLLINIKYFVKIPGILILPDILIR